MGYQWEEDTDERYVSDPQEPETDRGATGHVPRADALTWSFGITKPRVLSTSEALSWRLSDNTRSQAERGAEAGATVSWTRQTEVDPPWILRNNSSAHALSWSFRDPQSLIDSEGTRTMFEPSAPPLHPGAPVTPSAPFVFEPAISGDVYPSTRMEPAARGDVYSAPVLDPSGPDDVCPPPYHGDRPETPPPTYQEAIESGLIEPPS